MWILSVVLYPPVLFLLAAAAARGLLRLGDVLAAVGSEEAPSRSPHGA